MHIVFSCAAFSVSLIHLGEMILFPAARRNDMDSYLLGGNLALSGLLLGQIFILWFVTIYTRIRSLLGLAIPIILSSCYLALLVINWLSPYFYVYTERPVFTEHQYPWGGTYFNGDAPISIWVNYEWYVIAATAIFFVYIAVRQFKMSNIRGSVLFSSSILLYPAFFIHDNLLDYGFINSVYLAGFGIVLLIIFMSFVLTNEVVRTDEKLTQLNIELEDRVKQRTEELLDLTQKAETVTEELKEGESRLDHVLKSARMAVWEYDIQAQETLATDMFPLMLGYKPNQILIESDSKWRGYKLGHKSLAAQLLHEEDKQRYGEALAGMLAGKDHFEVEYRLRRADGEWGWYRDHGRIVKYDEKGKPLLAYGVVADIDGMKKLQLELVRAKENAETSNRAKSAFLANMSHELRTPLNTILGNTQILSKHKSLKDDDLLGIRAIGKSGDHLLELINSILEMSKIEAGQTVVTPSKFAVDSLISDIEMMFVERIQQKGLALLVESGSSFDGLVETDRSKINQVLINLMSNAVRYTESGTIVLRQQLIRNSGNEARLIVEVEDTGPGIGTDEQEPIFEPFTHGDIDSVNHIGTGLGLAISRQYAELLGGNLTVESQLGQGSTFRLDIPVSVLEVGPKYLAPSESRQIRGIEGDEQEFRILIVDDLAENRDVLVRMLQPVGFQIQEATGGQEAIDSFSILDLDLVLMDIRMPGVDGLKAIKAIKSTENGRNTPIIGISASVFEEDRAMVLNSGADDFLPKPFKENELFEKIGALLGITYVFEEDTSEPGDPSDDSWLTRERVCTLPEELLGSMREALKGGYMSRLKELIESESDSHPELSVHLLKLVNNFDYDSLSKLFLEKVTESPNKQSK